MNKYEIMLIFKPDVEDETRNTVMEGLKNALIANGGTVDKVDEWGLRDLAYEIKHNSKGYYFVMNVTTAAANIAEFDRLSRINANVVRHLTIRV